LHARLGETVEQAQLALGDGFEGGFGGAHPEQIQNFDAKVKVKAAVRPAARRLPWPDARRGSVQGRSGWVPDKPCGLSGMTKRVGQAWTA